MMAPRRTAALAAALFMSLATAVPARAELVLSDLIVELQPGKEMRHDIEIWNNSPERTFVATEPREVIDPALPSQTSHRDPDPEKLGLLVSPARMVLEPGQRRLIRIASLSAGTEREHVYRVTVKPVVGGIESDNSGLKIVVGYDVLVIVRPTQPLANVTSKRSGRNLTFSNSGNVSVEIIDGRQCNAGSAQCTSLPAKRLYPGATWTVQLQSDLPAEYTLKSPGHSDRKAF